MTAPESPGRLASLFGSASVYWLTHLVNAGLGFVLLPIMTRFLAPDDFGAMAMFTLAVSFAEPIVGLNINASITRRYFDVAGPELARYVTTSVLLLVPTTLGGCALVLALAGPLERLTLLPAPWLLAALGVATTNALASATLALLQVQVRPWSYALFATARSLASIGVALYLVVGRGLGWQGRAIGLAASGLASAVAALVILRSLRALARRWDRGDARHSLAYGLPLIPHSLGGIAMVITDRLFITHMVGLSSTGLYSVGYQVGFIVAMVQDGFNRAWTPWLFARLKTADEAERRRLVRGTYVYDVAILAVALGVSASIPAVLAYLVPDRFSGAWRFVLWIAVAYAFEGMYKMVANYIFYAGSTRLLAWVTLGAAIVNVPLNYVLIRRNGAIGAAQATTVVFFLNWIATWVLSQRVYPMPWRRALRPSVK